MSSKDNIQSEVRNYYDQKILSFGATPQGVDWNGEESQNIRFSQLIKLFEDENSFTVLDLGCGYGSFYEFLNNHFEKFSYKGYDLSANMIEAAKIKYPKANFENTSVICEKFDYIVSSGIFNVRQATDAVRWLDYIKKELIAINNSSLKGFAFNLLTSYSDQDKKKDYLYYANPSEIFEYCKKNFSRNVALLHDYNLYEFTILVRSDG